MDLTIPTDGNSIIPFILHEDDDIILVNKPAGIISQDDSTVRPSLSGLVAAYIRERVIPADSIYCAALHRLDMPVSGVMLFARNPVAAGRLSDDIRGRMVRKFYCAIVGPAPVQAQGVKWTELDQYYIRRRDRAYIVDESTPRASAVSLRYRVLHKAGLHCPVLVELVTGKRHQIRVQLSSIGSPVTGDRFYGSVESTGENIIALHAHHLCFTHPVSRAPVTVSAPLPSYMTELIGAPPDLADYLEG